MYRNALTIAVMLLSIEWSSISRGETAPQAPVRIPGGGAEIETAIQKVYPALVRIYVIVEEPSDGRMERERAAGSGAIISKDGYIVTNHHVAGNAIRMTCTLADGEEVEAVRVGTDAMADISVLKLKLNTRKHPDAPLAVATWGDSNKLKVGDVVLAMGSPMAVSQSVTKGIVSNTQMIMPKSMAGHFRLDGEDVGQIVRWIGHDAVIFGGNSGGPLVNLNGEIIGVNEIGLGSLGGAIPSNLARQVVRQLIATGHVKRSWLGVELQPRLKSSKDRGGVLVAGVVQGSPVDRAGIKAGDVITRFHGQPVDVELPEQLPLLHQELFSVPVGQPVEVVLLRDGKERIVQVKTEQLQAAQGDPVELKDWGIAVRDITRMMALERNRKSTAGVLIESIRGGSGVATAKLPLQPDDIILKVGDEPVDNAATLKKVTAALVEGKTERVSTLVLFERDAKLFLTVAKIGKEEERNRPACTAKPWSSMSTQVLTSDIAESLDMAGQRGVRVTGVFKRQAAEKAGIKVGDIIQRINGRQIPASLPGDGEVFDTMIRRLPLGGKAKLKLFRDGKPMEIVMSLEAPPINDDSLKQMTDSDFEFGARELSYTDRMNQQIPENLKGVLLQKVEVGGVASLGGLRGNDFLMSVDGKTTSTVEELKAILDRVRQDKPRRVVFFVRRGIHTLYCEVEPDYR